MSDNVEDLSNLLEDAEAEYLYDRISALVKMPLQHDGWPQAQVAFCASS